MPTFSKNKKAYHDYEVLDTFEAGIVLNGDEVKSIKANQANLKGAYIDIVNEEAFMREAHISRYPHSSRKEFNPTRSRKLLLHHKEIEKIEAEISEKGTTAIPLELYSTQGLIKVKIGICRGKKLYDKRKDLKDRASNLEVSRALKNYR